MSSSPRRAVSYALFGAALCTTLLACDGARRASAETADGSSTTALAGAGEAPWGSREDSLARARQDSINRARPDYVVDSILPIEEQLRRFREGTTPVTAFSGGTPSRKSLLAAIFAAVEQADTAALVRLTLTRDEYAWLVYPTSVHADGPMRQAPQLTWFMLESGSNVGRARLLARLGGRSLAVQGVRCPTPPVVEGENSIVSTCVVSRQDSTGAPIERRLFGALIERGGSWKVMSWSNGF
jgi:hypothetical protein